MKLIVYFIFISWFSFAAPIASPSTKISYDQYMDLIKLKVSEVPDLKELWNWNAREKLKNFYFGGGAFRGLILWINTNLAETDLETVKKMQVPNVDGLLIQKDADRDIYTPDIWKKRIKDWAYYKDWDVLDESFYQDTVKSRASRIDKIRANPKWIDDPLKGLQEFYYGKISMDTSGGPFDLKETNIVGDNWLGLSLRYLRFTFDLGDIVDVDQASLDTIKQLAQTKADWIPVNAEFGETWPNQRTHANNGAFRIRKALKKLYSGTKKDPLKLFSLLKKLDLLELLSMRSYNVISMTEPEIRGLFQIAQSNGFTFKELWLIGRMHGHTVENATFVHNILFEMAKTPDEVKWALTPVRETLSDSYRNQAGESIAAKLATEKGKTIKLTFEEFRKLARQFNRIDVIIALKKTQIAFAPDISEILRLAAPVIDNPNEDYKKAIRDMLHQQINAIIPKIQNSSELRQLEQAVNYVEPTIEMKKAFLINVKTADEFLEVTKPAFENPSDSYNVGLNKILFNEMDRFLKLKPTAHEVQSYALRLNSVEHIIKLKRAFLTETTSISEFEIAIRMSRTIPSEAYLSSSKTLLTELSDHYVKIKGSFETWNQLRSHLHLNSEDRSVWDAKVQRIQISPVQVNSCLMFYAS